MHFNIKSLILGFVILVNSAYAVEVGQHPIGKKTDYRKPGADIYLMNDSIQAIIVGQKSSITLQLKAAKNSGVVDVMLKPEDGLDLGVSEVSFSQNLANSQEIEIPLEVSVDAEGQHILHIFVSETDALGQTSSRAMALAFRTPAAVTLTKARSASSDGLIRLPVQEEIK